MSNSQSLLQIPGSDDGRNFSSLLQSNVPLHSDPAGTIKVIWGTTVNIQEVVSTFKDFLLNFKRKYVLEAQGQATTTEDNEPFYPPYLKQVC